MGEEGWGGGMGLEGWGRRDGGGGMGEEGWGRRDGGGGMGEEGWGRRDGGGGMGEEGWGRRDGGWGDREMGTRGDREGAVGVERMTRVLFSKKNQLKENYHVISKMMLPLSNSYKS